MQSNKLADIAEAQKWNPYFLAYAIETGAESPHAAFKRDGGGHEFSFWIEARWTELCKIEGVRRDASRLIQSARMVQFLAERLGDNLEAFQ